ncbi:MAG: LysR family transcriptional regulator [Blastomonas sp.]|uniref:LysR family transcriptional regulator n=2 Tax=Sphingomonadaceae TaxID=41297 RepID=UPI0006BA09FC|nr:MULTISPECIES: LysR family transcriptional regulator [unclassified Blastomonas]KPF73869.1 LuxR family transcriptional regulator [Blastomonas sp. AAP25]MCO5792050.1 LysR family transcriptional regulator [Blastomonas sp.]
MFDLKLLQAFVTVADAGSFTAAAHRLNSTQSTVSQQIGRLDDVVRRALFDRGARPVKLTPAGEQLIGYARRILALQREALALMSDPSGSRTIRVGVPDDLVTPEMSQEFARFSTRYSEIRLDVATGLSRELSRRFREGELDVAIVKEPSAQADAHASFREPLAWVEASNRSRPWFSPIPLVTFPPGGLYRDQMIDKIEAAGLRWYLAFTGNSLVSVLRAVEAGLGVSILPSATTGFYNIRKCELFEAVPDMALSIYAWEQDAATTDLLAAMSEIVANNCAADTRPQRQYPEA